MLDRPFYVSLLSLNLLQLLWLFAYKKALSFRETMILSAILAVQLIIGTFTDDHLIILLLIPFFLLQFSFQARKVQNWVVPALFLSFENTIILISWLLTLDFWDILFINHWISAETYSNYLKFFIFLQQFIFYSLLLFANYLNKRFNITATIHLLPKKYRLLSVLLLFFLFSAICLQQLSVLEGYSAPFFYSTFVIVCFTAFLSWNILLLVKRQNEQQYIMILNEKYEQEREKINRSNEFRHDYKQLLIGLTSYLETNDTQQALRLLHTIIDYSNSLLTPNLYKTIAAIQNPPIQGLLTNFLKRCSETDIQLKIQVTEKLTDFDMNIVDFIRCLSILLDNAYEAVQETELQVIEITITGDAQFVKVMVKNTYDKDKKVSLHSLLQNNFSTKENHQGKGLYILAKLIDNYKRASYQVSKKDNFFIVSFSISKLVEPKFIPQ
ncbi:sensor histidine kinase [Candidatus Enterococcus ikei]|uniref:GHKL domain-containing protein n=1 Tax=Candidatus Enterococcus ikei TaxID=2815326 RepID=A0ABS3H328_9ENTE|nr:GHKL domain-containing protein [Enterococcus sp. DIV0869a]MBO0441563.1 GHKL domain-containing protein [Enterococcus sp. DIV0869a]